MAAVTYENQNLAWARPRVDWGAIWAGVFTFVGIWAVFGVLGATIFASAANPNSPRSVGIGVGMAIWAIVLTIIAMYVGGRETGRLAVLSNRHDGVVHGMAMFGLSVIAILVMLLLGTSGMITGGTEVSAHSPYFLSMLSGLGWAGFLALFLGWLAAMGGASSGVQRKVASESNVETIRRAA